MRKGAFDAIERLVVERGNTVPPEVKAQVERIAREGGTPLAVAEDGRVLGVIHLKDIVKGGIRDRFAHLRAMGIKTVMITGDNSADGRRDRSRKPVSMTSWRKRHPKTS